MALFSRIFKWLAITFISINILVWSLSSPVIKHFLAPIFAEQGLRLSADTSIRFNPFLTRLSINDLQLISKTTNKKTLTVNKLTLQFALHQLLFKQLKVQTFDLDGFYIEVKQSAHNLNVAGFVINDNSTAKAPKQTAPTKTAFSQYQFILPKLHIHNGDIRLWFEGQLHQLSIDDLVLRDTLASADKLSSTLALTAKIDQAKTLLNAKLKKQNNDLKISTNLSIDNFLLKYISPHLLTKLAQLTQLNGAISAKSEQLITLKNNVLNIALSKATITPHNIELGLKHKDKSWQINITDMYSQLDGFSLNISPETTAKAKQKTQLRNHAEPEFAFDKFTLTMAKPLTFIDQSFSNTIERTVQIKSLTLGALSNTNTEVATPFNLELTSNKYATLNASGSLSPFANIPKYTINADLKELSLPALSPYIEQAAGFSLQSGQLNNNLTLELTGEQIVGKTKILIKGLATSGVSNNEVNLLQDNATMPLNMALGILKDSRGNVELDVPLSGSTSDPKFGLNSLVTLITQKAIISATQAYAIKTFLPYANIMSVALTAGDFLLKARFDDLPYQVKQIKPNSQQQAYLNNFIQLMTKNKNLTVKVCGISVLKDLTTRVTQSSKKAINKDLKSIAKKREQAFKNYVLAHSKIASERLLLCAPKIDRSKKAKPRIELSI